MVEIGVLYGDFSQMILDIIDPGTLYLIDPYGVNADNDIREVQDELYGRNQMKTAYSTKDDYDRLRVRFAEQIKNWQVIAERSYSYNAARIFADEIIDAAYIDSCHKYKSTKEELRLYLPKLKSGGLMCGHDYNIPGVKQAVD